MPDIRRGMTPGAAMSAHISIGTTILVLIVLRFLWRLAHPVAPESSLPAWQRASSELVHWLLYLAVLLTTLTGWLYASYRGWTIYLYGIAPLPRLVAEGSPLGHDLGELHETLTWVLLILIGIHVIAALVHLFVHRDRVMQRMLPGTGTV
jgi:cytochrome b561